MLKASSSFPDICTISYSPVNTTQHSLVLASHAMFNIPLDSLKVILETSLFSQSTTVVLTHARVLHFLHMGIRKVSTS